MSISLLAFFWKSGNIIFGISLVTGIKRPPNPAAGITTVSITRNE